MNINIAMVLGRLTHDPELHQTKSGELVMTVSVATNRRWTDKVGQMQERTEYHNVTLWGKIAELVKKNLKKGDFIFVEGRNETHEDEKGMKRTEITGNYVQFFPRNMRNQDDKIVDITL